MIPLLSINWNPSRNIANHAYKMGAYRTLYRHTPLTIRAIGSYRGCIRRACGEFAAAVLPRQRRLTKSWGSGTRASYCAWSRATSPISNACCAGGS